MFQFFKKKKNDEELFSVAQGTVIPITEVADEVFSSKMMGDGFAVQPTDGLVYTPIAGTVVSVFPTKHALGIKTDSGVEVLLHMGVDTVELRGEPFELFVKAGDKLAKGTKVAEVDLAQLTAAGKASDLIVILTNGDVVSDYQLTKGGQAVSSNEIIGAITVA